MHNTAKVVRLTALWPNDKRLDGHVVFAMFTNSYKKFIPVVGTRNQNGRSARTEKMPCY